MKLALLFFAVLLVGLIAVESASAQATATQSVTLAVQAVYRISVSGNPAPLTINAGTAGVDTLTTVSDASTSYNITQNFANTVKITAELNSPLSAGYFLHLTMQSNKGTSAGAVDISSTTAGSGVPVVTAIARGADANKTITYAFTALASAGTLASTVKTVTLTLTN